MVFRNVEVDVPSIIAGKPTTAGESLESESETDAAGSTGSPGCQNEQTSEDEGPKTIEGPSSKFLDKFEECQFCTKLLLPAVWKHHEKQCSARLKDVVPGYCVACKKDFKSAGLLAKHGLEHCKDGTPVCLFCNNRKLRVSKGEEMCLNTLRKHIYHSHAFRVKEFPYTCNLCDEACENRRSMENHLILHQQDSTPITKDCEVGDIKSCDDNEMDALANRKEISVSYCPACKGKEFNNSKLLDRHLKKNHGQSLSPEDLKTLSMKKVTSAKRHTGVVIKTEEQEKDKTITDAIVSPVIDSVSSITLSSPLKRSFGVDDIIASCTSPTKLYSRPFAFPFHKRKKAKSASSTDESLSNIKTEDCEANETTTTSCSDDHIPINSKARVENGSFVCLKCTNYETKSEQEFYSHVKFTHVWSEEEILNRSLNGSAEKSDFWCPECDMTFLSKSTLTMHIRANHEFLKDIKYYLEQLGYEGEVPLLENQCSVCFVLCEDENGFQKHFRTHGLAFLKLQQQKRQKKIS